MLWYGDDRFALLDLAAHFFSPPIWLCCQVFRSTAQALSSDSGHPALTSLKSRRSRQPRPQPAQRSSLQLAAPSRRPALEAPVEVAEATERRVMDRQRGSLLFRLRQFAPNIFHTWQKSKIPLIIQLLWVNPLQV